MGIRTVSVKLALDVSRYVSGGQQAIKVTRDLRGELAQAASKGDLDAVASQATAAGLALTGAFAGITMVAARFDQAMSSVSAATMASAADLERLRDAALDAGAQTAFSATEAAQGIEELAKAGVATSDVLSGGLAGALDLAAAGQIGVAEAAESAASAMTQFQLSGQDVTHIADLLAAGAGKAQGSVGDMSMALKQSGLVAAQTGLSIEEATGTLAAFASAGLLGSDAGTSFKTMLLRLAAPTGEAADLMEELGISAFNSQGQFVGMAAFAGNLQGALQGMSEQQRQTTLATIFGTDAIRAASIVYQQGQTGIQGWIDAVDDQGFAAETAARKLDNLMGDIEALTGSLETLAIQSGGGANDGLRFLVQGATALVNTFGELPPALSNGIVIMMGISGAALLAFSAFVKMRGAAALALAEMRAMGPAGTMAAGGLSRMSRWAVRVTGALVGLQLAAMAVDAVVGKDLNPQVDALGEGLSRWARTGQVSGETARLLGDDMGKLETSFRSFNSSGFEQGLASFIETMSGTGGIDDSMHMARERVEAVDQALAQLVQSGRAEEAAAAFDKLAEVGAEHNHSVEDLLEMMPAYAAAVELGGTASSEAAGGMEDMGAAAQAAAEQIEELRAAFDELFGIEMDLDRAQLAYREGLAALTEELDDGAASLSLNSAEGRENQSAVLDQIQAVADLRQANLDNNMSLDEANARYDRQLNKIEQMLIDRGFEESAVRAVIDAYRDIPARTVAVVESNAPAAAGRVRDFIRALENIPDSETVTITTRHVNQFITQQFGPNASTLERWGGVLTAARGRLVPAHITASPTVLYGERETGREAYVPMRGDPQRSKRILAEAASWYGMQLSKPSYGTPYQAAGRSGEAGGGVTTVTAQVDQRALTQAVARAIDGAKLVIDDRGRGRLEAQTSNLLRRAG